MRSRTKWIVAGGAAALVITPVVAVYGSPTMVDGPEQRGLVIDAEAANRARVERVTTTASPTPSATMKAKATKPAAEPSAEAEPTGKKTVSAVSPISPKSPKSPDTPG
ncbi:MAG TPA: hypothetical protein VIT65_20645 [Microlunatus sp.]